jgi:hypothetical protein
MISLPIIRGVHISKVFAVIAKIQAVQICGSAIAQEAEQVIWLKVQCSVP